MQNGHSQVTLFKTNIDVMIEDFKRYRGRFTFIKEKFGNKFLILSFIYVQQNQMGFIQKKEKKRQP